MKEATKDYQNSKETETAKKLKTSDIYFYFSKFIIVIGSFLNLIKKIYFHIKTKDAF